MRSSFTLRIKPLLLAEVREVAEVEGVTLNQLINIAVAEKLSTLRTEKYFSERAGRAGVPNALNILKRAGLDNPPAKGDEMRRSGTRK